MRSAVLGLAVLSLLACSKKEDAEALRPEPSAPISATPSAAPVASATAAAATQEPAAPAVSVASAEPAKVDEPTGDFTPFEGVADAEYFPVGKAVILCEKRCEYPSDPAPKVWLVQAGKLREAPELWPAKAWANLKGIEGEHIVTHVQFSGSYPEVVYAYGAAQADMGEDLLPSATYTAKRWENTPFTQRHQAPPPLPQQFDEALRDVPIRTEVRDTFVYGAGAPLMVAETHTLWIRTDEKWVRQPAPWGIGIKLRRLADGSTLGVAGRVFLVSSAGKITEIEGVEADDITDQAGVAWLVNSDGISKPTHPERFKLAPLTPPAPSGPAPSDPAPSDPAPSDPAPSPPTSQNSHTLSVPPSSNPNGTGVPSR